MKSRKKRQLTASEKRALTSAGLIVTRYDAGGERATVQQLALRVSRGVASSHAEPQRS